MHLICPAKFCITFVFLFLLGITAVPGEIDNNAYAKCLGAKRRTMGDVQVAYMGFRLPITNY